MAAQACNPGTQEAADGEMEGQGILEAQTKTTRKRKYLKFLFVE